MPSPSEGSCSFVSFYTAWLSGASDSPCNVTEMGCFPIHLAGVAMTEAGTAEDPEIDA